MHMRGRPEEWRTLEPVSDIVVLVKRELREWSDKTLLAGVKRERTGARSRLRLWQEFRTELSDASSFRRIPPASLPLARRCFTEIFRRENAEPRWPGCSSGPALVCHPGNRSRRHSQRSAHRAHARRSRQRGSRARCGCSCLRSKLPKKTCIIRSAGSICLCGSTAENFP